MDIKRLARLQKRRLQREHNKHGHRIYWIRERLSITRQQASRETEIPGSTLADWECGTRTDSWEEAYILAAFYNEAWQKLPYYPSYLGRKVTEISFQFLMLGHNADLDELKKNARELRAKVRELEKTLAFNNLEKNQLPLL